MRWVAAWACGLVLFGFGGCAGSAPPADPAVVAMEESRLMAPFQQKRTILAESVALEMTANFWDDLVVQGSAETREEMADGGVRYEYASPGGSQLRLTLGETLFVVMQKAQVVVLGGTSEMRCDAQATGVSVREADGGTEHLPAIAIQNGVLRRDAR